MVTFSDVKTTLGQLVEGRDIPRMKITHGGNAFSWDTAGELRNAVAVIFGTTYRLIDPALVGNGRADETFLVQVLMGPLDDQDIPRMPFRGPFATADQIKVIRDWINDGAGDDASACT
ncbi:hypothetical protein ACKWRH_10845 [Bradyrhizobium sp. Pa8]|uniref:hypothetical protein n=1 Tax=Bradyrhizobium sp. Pa8 TaxID=3386552 RepID=UPI00403F6F23